MIDSGHAHYLGAEKKSNNTGELSGVAEPAVERRARRVELAVLLLISALCLDRLGGAWVAGRESRGSRVDRPFQRPGVEFPFVL